MATAVISNEHPFVCVSPKQPVYLCELLLPGKQYNSSNIGHHKVAGHHIYLNVLSSLINSFAGYSYVHVNAVP